MEAIKAITYSECPAPEIFGKLRMCSRRIEQAGQGYEELKMRHHLMRNGTFEYDRNADQEEAIEEEVEEVKIDEEKMRNKKKKRKQSLQLRSNTNLYEVMGFQDWGEDFEAKLLKKRYMRLALKHHPDKLGADYDEEAKRKWLKVETNGRSRTRGRL